MCWWKLHKKTPPVYSYSDNKKRERENKRGSVERLAAIIIIHGELLGWFSFILLAAHFLLVNDYRLSVHYILQWNLNAFNWLHATKHYISINMIRHVKFVWCVRYEDTDNDTKKKNKTETMNKKPMVKRTAFWFAVTFQKVQIFIYQKAAFIIILAQIKLFATMEFSGNWLFWWKGQRTKQSQVRFVCLYLRDWLDIQVFTVIINNWRLY